VKDLKKIPIALSIEFSTVFQALPTKSTLNEPNWGTPHLFIVHYEGMCIPECYAQLCAFAGRKVVCVVQWLSLERHKSLLLWGMNAREMRKEIRITVSVL
jgi:hypothetical protein